jgi:hypothetical protein
VERLVYGQRPTFATNEKEIIDRVGKRRLVGKVEVHGGDDPGFSGDENTAIAGVFADAFARAAGRAWKPRCYARRLWTYVPRHRQNCRRRDRGGAEEVVRCQFGANFAFCCYWRRH